jgi:hypothetical protein
MMTFTVTVVLNKVVGTCKSFIMALNHDISPDIYIYKGARCVSTYGAPYYGCQGVSEESPLVGSERSSV